MPSTVTLAMIVRNEAAKLTRCLESAVDVVDEVVVVDTGSIDTSVEIANSFGAKTRSIEWPDAFDEARNVSLEMATMDWIIVLDADEWFVPDVKRPLLDAIAEETRCGFHVTCLDLDASAAHTEMSLLRLFRNDPLLRYRGTLHEQVQFDEYLASHPGSEIGQSGVRFFHDGYVGASSDEHLRRDVRLLKKELALRPGSLYYESILASVLMDLKDPEGPGRQRRLANLMLERSDEPNAPDLQLQLILVRELVTMSDSELRSKRASSLIELSYRWFGNFPKIMYAVAELEIRRKSAEGAFRALSILKSMAESGVYSRYTSFPPAVLTEGLWFKLGIVSLHLGNKEVAKAALEKAVLLEPENAVAHRALSTL